MISSMRPRPPTRLPLEARGWFVRLESHGAGEKVIGSTVTFDHVLRFQTYQPLPPDADAPCGPPRSAARRYALDVRTALPRNTATESEEDEPEEVPASGPAAGVALRISDARWQEPCEGCRPRPFGIVRRRDFRSRLCRRSREDLMAKARTSAGFTLIELMIALAIVAITTAIAASTYRGYLRRGHRSEAVQALLAAAVEQEKFHLANGRYGDRLDAAAGEEPPGSAGRVADARRALRTRCPDPRPARNTAWSRPRRATVRIRRARACRSTRAGAARRRTRGGADSTARCWQ